MLEICNGIKETRRTNYYAKCEGLKKKPIQGAITHYELGFHIVLFLVNSSDLYEDKKDYINYQAYKSNLSQLTRNEKTENSWHYQVSTSIYFRYAISPKGIHISICLI